MSNLLSTERPILLRYAALGIPLGFLGLPLYVYLPKHLSDTLPISITAIGTILFVSRFIDCAIDPLVGLLSDRYSENRSRFIALSIPALAVGMVLLFCPLLSIAPERYRWLLFAGLALTFLGYSLLATNYYAFGVSLVSDKVESSKLSALREGAALVGVIAASIIPSLLQLQLSDSLSYQIFSWIFVALLVVCATLFLTRFWVDGKAISSAVIRKNTPETNEQRWLFVLLFCNAIPPSITASLFLFFVQDVLQLKEWSGGLLLLYFVSAALSMPMWVRIGTLLGKKRALFLSMLGSLGSFSWAYTLGPSDGVSFAWICVFSGFALGGDLTLLPAMLSDSLLRSCKAGGLEFGIWNFINKLTLAGAAGIALPSLAFLGYTPGSASSTESMSALSVSYAIIPSIFKVLACVVLVMIPNYNTEKKI